MHVMALTFTAYADDGCPKLRAAFDIKVRANDVKRVPEACDASTSPQYSFNPITVSPLLLHATYAAHPQSQMLALLRAAFKTLSTRRKKQFYRSTPPSGGRLKLKKAKKLKAIFSLVLHILQYVG